MHVMRRAVLFAVFTFIAGFGRVAAAQTKVLFDAAHAQTAGNADWVIDEDTCGTATITPTPAQSGITSTTSETYWSGAFSSFGVALAKAGYQLSSLPVGGRITYGDSTNAQDLSKYKVFIIPEPNVQLTAAEKSAIISFVRNGGGLFMISDHSGSDRNNDGWDSPKIFNDLMSGASWGIHYQVAGEANNYFDDNPDHNYTTDTNSPIVYKGPFGALSSTKGLGLFGATSLTLNPSANPNVKGHIWMTSGTHDTNTQVTFATSTDGTGRIAAIGDSSPAEDSTNNCGHTTYDGWAVSTYDNATIHLNAVAWLAGAGGSTTDTTPPTAPSGLTATAASSSQINLSWTASTDNVGVTGYNVLHSTDNVTFTTLATVTGTSYSHTGLAASSTHYYKVTAKDAAGNVSTASNVASATTSASSSCTSSLQPIANPGFESGSVSWTATSGVITTSTTSDPSHAGSYLAYLDGYGTTHTDTLYQTVSIPAAACSATLNFWLRVITSETTTTTAYDTLSVQVRNSSGTVLATLATYSNLSASSAYAQKTFDLISYRGQTIQIYFVGSEDSSLQTSFLVDDVTLNITQ